MKTEVTIRISGGHVPDFVASKMFKDYVDYYEIFATKANNMIDALNKAWDKIHPEEMEIGSKLYLEYNDYMAEALEVIAYEINTEHLYEHRYIEAYVDHKDAMFKGRYNLNSEIIIEMI